MSTKRRPSKKTRCPCGSGNRYVQCCKATHDSLAKMMAEYPAMIERDRAERARYEQAYGFVRTPVGFDMDGKKLVRIGDIIYKQVSEGPYNVPSAIHDHALWFFGEEVLAQEESKEFAHRHPAIQWLHASCDMAERLGRHTQNGNAAAWHRFAYDLFTIRDNAVLKKDLEKKLLVSTTFQAARYELKVAAICATAGLDLYFEDESDTSKKHPEFFGVDRFSGARIAVEAKSRHRDGVLGFRGGAVARPGQELGVRKCLVEAYRKKPGAPFYIFIDCNMPPASTMTMARWEAELHQLIADLDAEGYANPCPANSVFFTNDPSHYVGTGEIGGADDNLWVRNFKSDSPQFPHPETDMVQRLMIAHRQRVASPGEFAQAD